MIDLLLSPRILEGFLMLAGGLGGAGVLGSWIRGWPRKILFPLTGALFSCLTICFLGLGAAFLGDNFFFLLVAENSHTSMDFLHKVGATWGQSQGSLLLWIWCLSGYTFYSSWQRWEPDFYKGVVGIMLFFTTLFIGVEIGWFNPFERSPEGVREGLMLNPLLQDGSIDLHPPLLFLGLVGTSLPFAIALTGLKISSVSFMEKAFLRSTLRKVWSALTVGIALGSFWAFYELGWGGFWFWDPVENLSLLPWLALTGALHAGYAGWALSSLFFCLEAWLLALLSTILIRSGLLLSVHGFAEDRGPGLFVPFLWGMGVLGVIWIFWQNRQKFPLVSPGTTRLSWAALCCLQSILMITFFGTVYPLFAQAWGAPVSVGAPYFNTVLKPFALVILVGSGASLSAPSWQAIVVGVALCLSISVLVLPTFDLWNILLLTAAFWVISQAFVHSFKTFLKEEKPQWSRWFGHFGLGVVAVGVILEGAWRREAVLWVQPGEADVIFSIPVRVGEFSLEEHPLYRAIRVPLTTPHGQLIPERRFWAINGQTTSESRLQWVGPLSLLDVSVGEIQETGEVQVRLGFHRAVVLIWLGALISALGLFVQGFLRKRWRDDILG